MHAKYSDKLRKYTEHPIQGYAVQFWTFTFKNVDVISREWLEMRDKQFGKFWNRLRMRGFKAKFGFRAKECTWHADRGFHYHYHVLFYGPVVDLKNKRWNVSNLWKEATGDSFMVKVINDFTDANKGLSYILKYVCKVQESSDGLVEYFRIRSGARDFNTFGEDFTRKKKGEKTEPLQKEFKVPFACPTCGGSWRKSGFFTTSWRGEDVPERFHVEDARPLPSYRARSILYRYRYTPVRDSSSQTTLSSPCGADRADPGDVLENLHLSIVPGGSRADRLLSRIDYLFDQELNADVIEAVIGPENVDFLLKTGELYSTRPGRYSRLT